MKPIAPWLLALALVVGLVLTVRDTSYARAEARRWRVMADSLAKVSARVDTIYRDRTRTLTREVVRLDTLTDSVHVWKHDTVRVVEYVERADSVVRACLAVVSLCEERVGLRDSRIAALEGQLRATAAQRPTLMDRMKPVVVFGGLGYLVGRLAP